MNINSAHESLFMVQEEWSDCLSVPNTNALTKLLYKGPVHPFSLFPLSAGAIQQTEGVVVAVCFGKWQLIDRIRTHQHSQIPQLVLKVMWNGVSQPSAFCPVIFRVLFLLLRNNCAMMFLLSDTLSGPIWLGPPSAELEDTFVIVWESDGHLPCKRWCGLYYAVTELTGAGLSAGVKFPVITELCQAVT